MKYFILSFLMTLSFTTSQVVAQDSTQVTNHFHDFDFWLGSWDVYKYGTDTLYGHSEITAELDHFMINENYKSVTGPYHGVSSNTYNKVNKRWEQFYTDNRGFLLHIKGGLEEDKMILSDCDERICNKIIWTPSDDGTVRQEWYQSNDGKKTWVKAFDGHYKPKVVRAKY